ncbi:MAG: 7TM diverse intracellular signaling domain-containing protein [Lutibacter sp.]
MKKIVLVFLIINLFCSCTNTPSNNKSKNFEISHFNDLSNTLSIQEIIKKPFQINPSQTIGFNLKSKTLWCKIVVLNYNLNKKYLLVLNDALIDNIDFYAFENNQWKSKSFGIKTRDKKSAKYENSVIPLNLFRFKKNTFYLKIRSRIAKDIPIKMIPEDAFIKKHNIDLISFGLLYGVLVAFIIYNFIIYFFTRAIFYLYFSIAVFFTTIVQAFLNGHASFYLLPNHPEISFKLFFISICFGVYFVTAFSQQILDINQIKEKLNFKLLQLIKYSSLLGVIIVLISNYKFFSLYIITIVSFHTLILFYLGIFKWIKQNKIARLFTLGWIVYFLGIFSNFLRSQNLIAVNWFSTNITFVSYLGEIILFSVALASYYHLKKTEKKMLQLQFTEKLNIQVTEKTKELTKIIEQKNELMREIHHRVKNNIQIITSLFNLKERRTTNKEAKSILEASKNKLKSIALVHEQLYLNNSFNTVDTKTYFEQLLKQLNFNYGNKAKIKLQIESALLNNDQAIPLGLIINEIITNSLKYAFKEEPFIITFNLNTNNQKLIIHLSDNGIGFNLNNINKNSLGLTIIKGLVHQLNGRIDVKSNYKGTAYQIEIPIEK